MTIVFSPLPTPAVGKKRCANARPTTVTKINNYFHEETSLPEILFSVFTILNQHDLLEGSCLFHGLDVNNNNTDTFTLTYTIPQCVSTEVRITDAKDFGEMVDEATYKDTAEVKFFVVEQVWSNFFFSVVFLDMGYPGFYRR